MIEIKHCQICNGNNFLRITKTKDYSTSNEEFVIVKCQDCEFLFTNPRVKEEKIGEYFFISRQIYKLKNLFFIFKDVYSTGVLCKAKHCRNV